MSNIKMNRGCQWWYCRYKVHGKEKVIPLGVKIEGSRPARLSEMGDREFEMSRMKAQIAADEFLDKLNVQQRKANLLKEIYRVQSGGDEVPEYTVDELYDVWLKMGERSDRRAETVKGQIGKFISFMKKRYPTVTYTYQVTRTHADAFLESEPIRCLAPSTYNGILSVLKSSMKESGSDAFNKIRTRHRNQIHRVPFTEEEIKLIREEAEKDPFLRPVVIIAICTGMRLADCCSLRWDAIDEQEGVVRVKTGKTGAWVVVPLFDWLKTELSRHERRASEFVLPRQRYKHMADSSYFNTRLKKILLRIGFGEQADHYRFQSKTVEVEDVHDDVELYLATLPDTEKTQKIRRVFTAYMDGLSFDQVSEQLSVSKGMVSLYLNEIEEGASVSFIRGKCRSAVHSPEPVKSISIERDDGVRRASLRGFHAFRTTWVTLALKRNVPIETVKLVTGHRTVEIVLEHYYNPNQRDIRDSLNTVMPFSDSQKEVA